MAGTDQQAPALPFSHSKLAQEHLDVFYDAFEAHGTAYFQLSHVPARHRPAYLGLVAVQHLTLIRNMPGKERPQGWSCTARPRLTGKTVDFVYTSPLNTPYRSRTHAWQACGLNVASAGSTRSDSQPFAKRQRVDTSLNSAQQLQVELSACLARLSLIGLTVQNQYRISSMCVTACKLKDWYQS